MSSIEKEKSRSADTVTIDLSSVFKGFVKGCFKYWWLIVVIVLIGASLMFFKSKLSYTPLYRSQTTFTVTTNTGNSSSGENYNFYYDSATAEQLGLTFPHILSSSILTDAIKDDLGTDVINGTLSASTITDSNMVTMVVTSPDPQDAKLILESAIKVYPQVSRFVIGETKFNIIDPATVATEPFNKPDYKKDLITGAFFGFIASMALMVIYAFMRKTIHKNDRLQVYTSLPCYVSFPFVKRKERKSKKEYFPKITDKGISPYFSENTETLRLKVVKALEKKNGKILLVTSTLQGEGKSLVAVNLAMKLAKNGKKVALVDGDLRKQNLGQNIGLNIDVDMSGFVADNYWLKRITTYDEKSGIVFIGGSKPLKKASSFLSKHLRFIVEKLRDSVDYIIIDSPPAGDFEDALVISDYADAVLYVVKQDYAPESKVIDTITLLETEKVNVIGYVFNGVTGVLRSYGYGKYGRYGHYSRYGYYGKYGRYGHYSKYNRYGYSDTENG